MYCTTSIIIVYGPVQSHRVGVRERRSKQEGEPEKRLWRGGPWFQGLAAPSSSSERGLKTTHLGERKSRYLQAPPCTGPWFAPQGSPSHTSRLCINENHIVSLPEERHCWAVRCVQLVRAPQKRVGRWWWEWQTDEAKGAWRAWHSTQCSAELKKQRVAQLSD